VSRKNFRGVSSNPKALGEKNGTFQRIKTPTEKEKTLFNSSSTQTET
jgi:hypothetical protein